MNLRVVLLLLVLAAGLAGLVWKLRTNPDHPGPAPASAAGAPNGDAHPTLGEVPASPPRGGESNAGQPRPSTPAAAAPSTSRSPASAATPTGTSNAGSDVPEAEQPPLAPVKLVELDPIQGGGVAAIESRHHNSTFEERAQRLAVIESAFTFGEPPEPEERIAFEALKAELIWLREHPGTPSKAPPK